MKPFVLLLLALHCLFSPCPAQSLSEHYIKGEKNFYSGIPSRNSDGSYNAVVENPAGSNSKWEVTKPGGELRWEFRKGKPRVVDFLPYPTNYGMIPRTLLSKATGGDGDPIDVLILGSAIPRGTVVRIRVIGAIKLLDRGKQDHKLIAIPLKGLFDKIDSLKELKHKYPGALEILIAWFSKYKGPKKMVFKGVVGLQESQKILTQAIKAFKG